MKRQSIKVLVIVTLWAYCCWADWPQYLGPARNAVSPEKGLLRSWPENGPRVLWTFPLGEGWGGAAVSEGKVYVLDRVDDRQEVVRCIDLAIGKEEWTFAYEAPGGRISHPGSRSVPAVDGDYVYTCGCFGDVYCISKRTRQPVWKKNIWRDFGGGDTTPIYGITQSPLIFRDMVILASQTEKAGVVAYDRKTGNLKWASPPLPGRACYVSPTAVRIGEEDHIVMVSACSRPEGGRGRRPARPRGEGPPPRGRGPRGDRPRDSGGGPPPPPGRQDANVAPDQVKGAVLGLDPQTGRTLWSYEGWQCQSPIPNVTAIGDGRIFVTGGYEAGSAMFRVDKKDGKFVVTELYKTQAFGTHVHPAVYYKGHLYAQCTDNRGRRDGMLCMDLDGNVKWKTETSPAFDKGGLVLADDLILTVDGTDGILYLIEPTPERFKPLASAKLLDTKECWAALALADGKLLIRDKTQMKCVAVR